MLIEQNVYGRGYTDLWQIKDLERDYDPTTGAGLGGKNFSWTGVF